LPDNAMPRTCDRLARRANDASEICTARRATRSSFRGDAKHRARNLEVREKNECKPTSRFRVHRRWRCRANPESRGEGKEPAQANFEIPGSSPMAMPRNDALWMPRPKRSSGQGWRSHLGRPLRRIPLGIGRFMGSVDSAVRAECAGLWPPRHMPVAESAL
jgi:hypothetical protein